MPGVETWVLVVWLLKIGAGDPPPKPQAITYPDKVACEKAFERVKSSKAYVVRGKSGCVRFVPVAE